MKPHEIITDAEVEHVHANANFGPIVSKRAVIDFALLKTACGYSTGSTARRIIEDHGLAVPFADPMRVPRLTKKGREYLWAVFGRQDF